MKATCSQCGQVMSAQSVVCPACGHRQVDRGAGGVGAAKLSSEEVRALLAVEKRNRQDDAAPATGAFLYRLLVPRASGGVAHLMEWALTVVGLPVIAGSCLFLALSLPFARRAIVRAEHGEYTAALFASVVGTFVLRSFLPWALGWSAGVALAVGVISSIGLLVRAHVRSRAGLADRNLWQ